MIDYKEFSDEELICRLRAGESAIEDYLFIGEGIALGVEIAQREAVIML